MSNIYIQEPPTSGKVNTSKAYFKTKSSFLSDFVTFKCIVYNLFADFLSIQIKVLHSDEKTDI